jgi:ABC-2 type transport system permease protein
VLFPLLLLFFFGTIFADDEGLSRFDVLVVGEGPVIDRLPEELLDTRTVGSLDGGVREVDGDAVAVIAESDETVVVRYQASDQVGGQAVLNVVSSGVGRANLDALGGEVTYEVDAAQVEDESLGSMKFLTPGLLSWAISIGAVVGSAMTLVNWRTRGLLCRLRLTPAPASEIAVTRIAVSLGVAFVQTALFLAVGVVVFGLDLTGAWWMALPLVVAGTLAFLGIGLLVGALCRTVEGTSAVANLIVLPMAFVSGALIPLEAIPSWLETASQALPLAHLLDGLRDVMVRGQAPSAALPEILVLLTFAAATDAISTRVFRWERA